MSFAGTELSWFVVSSAGLVIMWFWTAMEGRLEGLGSPWRRLERRAFATVIAYVALLGAVALHAWTDMGDWALSLCSLGAILSYHKVSHEPPSFWDHKRVRWIVALILVTGFCVAHWLMPVAQLMALGSGAYVFYRNFDAHLTVAKATFQDLHAMQARIARLEGERELSDFMDTATSQKARPPHGREQAS